MKFTLKKENKSFKISSLDHGKSNREYFNAYEWLELAHIIYRCKNIKRHVNLPLQEKSAGLFRLYLADVGIFTYQSQVNQEKDILTIPHYATFLLAEDLKNGTLST